MSMCVDDVARWMKSNRLQLYMYKTEQFGAPLLEVKTSYRLRRCELEHALFTAASSV
jgi:hypothetical protein